MIFTVDVSESYPLSSFGDAFVNNAFNTDLVNSNGINSGCDFGCDFGCDSSCDSGCDLIDVFFIELLNSLL